MGRQNFPTEASYTRAKCRTTCKKNAIPPIFGKRDCTTSGSGHVIASLPVDVDISFFEQIEFGSCLQGKNQVVPGPFPKSVNIPKAALFAGSAAYIADQALPVPVWSAGNVILNLTTFFNDFQAAVGDRQ